MSSAKLLHISEETMLPVESHRRRTVVINHQSRVDFVDDLLHMVQSLDFSTSRFTGVGGFDRVVLGVFKAEVEEYERIAIDEPVEILSLAGSVVFDADEPTFHANVVVGKGDGTAHGGHLLEATVGRVVEVIIEESPPHMQLRIDKKTSLAKIAVSDTGPDTVRWRNVNQERVKIEIRKGNDNAAVNNPVVATPTMALFKTHIETSEGEDFFWVQIDPPGDGNFRRVVCSRSGRRITIPV